MNKPSVSAGVVAGVALGAAALGAAAVAVRAACLQVARTRNGLARVKRVHDEGGDEIRVLVQGGGLPKRKLCWRSLGRARLCVLSCI